MCIYSNIRIRFFVVYGHGFIVRLAQEAFSLAVEQKWITLLLLLLALRALQRAAVDPPPPMSRGEQTRHRGGGKAEDFFVLWGWNMRKKHGILPSKEGFHGILITELWIKPLNLKCQVIFAMKNEDFEQVCIPLDHLLWVKCNSLKRGQVPVLISSVPWFFVRMFFLW